MKQLVFRENKLFCLQIIVQVIIIEFNIFLKLNKKHIYSFYIMGKFGWLRWGTLVEKKEKNT